MARLKFETIDQYINIFPSNVQGKLKAIRQAIKKAAPKATEGISYGIPTFYLNGKYVIYFAGFKEHVSLYPTSDGMVKAIKELEKFRVSKGTLRFPIDQPLPMGLIKKAIRFKVKENLLRTKQKKR
jgi:uncharacterized protein YdhG (YjbR/CyaY superfamily)